MVSADPPNSPVGTHYPGWHLWTQLEKHSNFFPPLTSWPWPKVHASTIIREILVMPLDIDDQFQKHNFELVD